MFALGQGSWVDLWQVDRAGGWQGQPSLRAKGCTVFQIARQAFLTQIQIKRADPMAQPRQRRCNMHRAGRFARPAFFISDNDNMRHARPRVFYAKGAPRWRALELFPTRGRLKPKLKSQGLRTCF